MALGLATGTSTFRYFYCPATTCQKVLRNNSLSTLNVLRMKLPSATTSPTASTCQCMLNRKALIKMAMARKQYNRPPNSFSSRSARAKMSGSKLCTDETRSMTSQHFSSLVSRPSIISTHSKPSHPSQLLGQNFQRMTSPTTSSSTLASTLSLVKTLLCGKDKPTVCSTGWETLVVYSTH